MVRMIGKTHPNADPNVYLAEVASEALKGRVFEVSLADLNSAEDLDYRKIKLIGEEVQGKALLTNFYGMDVTRDKLNGLIRKWQTLIEASADVKTIDGYTLRLFALAFTKRRPNQIRKTSYAQSSQIRAIRKKMVDIMTAGASDGARRESGAGVASTSVRLMRIAAAHSRRSSRHHLLRLSRPLCILQRRPSRTLRASSTSSSRRQSRRRSRRRATASTLSRTSTSAR